MDDREFVAAVEACTLPPEQFPHRAHVRLAWLYLRLLLMRQAIDKVLVDETDPGNQRLETRIAELHKRLADEAINDDLRRSLTSQLEILEQRKAQRTEGGEKLAFLRKLDEESGT